MTDQAQNAPETEQLQKLSLFKGLSSATGPAGRKLSADAIRLARREAVWELRCRGWTQERIASAIETTQATISRDLAWCHKEYKARLLDDVAQVKAEHRAILEHVLDEALQAWEESKKEALEVSRKSLQAQGQSSSGSGTGQQQPTIKPVEQTTKAKGQTGEVAYLREARAAMAEIRDIMGAEAPRKVAFTDPTGEKEAKGSPGVVIVVPSRLTLEEAMQEQHDTDSDQPGD